MEQWIKSLLGKSLTEVEKELQKKKIPYRIEYSCGHKDKEILTEKYVIRVVSCEDHLKLTISMFQTQITK